MIELAMGKVFTPDRLMRIRRMRKARRLFQRNPLFAFEEMRLQYPQYTYGEFLDDLRRRRSPKGDKRKKSPLCRYGRYARMQQLLGDYERSGDTDALWMAAKLRERMTKPYRVMARVGGTRLEFTFSPLVPIHAIERLTAEIARCTSKDEVQQVIRKFRETEKLL